MTRRMTAGMRKWILSGLKGLGFVLPVAWYPVLFVYFRNCAEVSFSQVWFPLVMFTITAAVYFLIFSAVARNIVSGGVTAMAAVLLTAFWQPVEYAARNMCWSLRYWHLVPLALACCWALAIGLARIARRYPSAVGRVRAGLFSVFSLLIVYNISSASPILWNKMQGEVVTEEGNYTHVMQKPIPDDLPNVYFIILDEYAPFSMMEKYFGHVPTEFIAFLKQHNFNVSSTSHNPSFYTTEVLAGLIGMRPPELYSRYTLTADGRFGKFVFSHTGNDKVYAESKLMRFFKERGYTVYIASMLGDIFNIDTPRLFCDEYYQLPVDQRGKSWENSLMSVMLERSALGPLQFLLPVSKDSNYYNRMVEGIFNWIQESSQKAAPRFLWAHVICPHSPFMFKSDGGWRQEAGDVMDSQNYLEQYTYVTLRIMKVLEILLKDDPSSVILVMSDHSYRKISTYPVGDMSCIFNVVYYRGEALDVEGLSGLDTERLVLNRVFGTKYPVSREACSLVGVVP